MTDYLTSTAGRQPAGTMRAHGVPPKGPVPRGKTAPSYKLGLGAAKKPKAAQLRIKLSNQIIGSGSKTRPSNRLAQENPLESGKQSAQNPYEDLLCQSQLAPTASAANLSTQFNKKDEFTLFQGGPKGLKNQIRMSRNVKGFTDKQSKTQSTMSSNVHRPGQQDLKKTPSFANSLPALKDVGALAASFD